jgi:SAM-dependent methyltransferase
MASTTLDQVTPQIYRQCQRQARAELKGFNSSIIVGARAWAEQLARKNGQQPALLSELYFRRFERKPLDHAPIDIAIRFLFPEAEQKGLTGVNLMSGYGPYVHFLRDARGLRGIVGLDNDSLALEYAAKMEVPVLRGSADKLPIISRSLDLVFSRGFLDLDHLHGAEPIGPVLSEVKRCLKPGGVFISMSEDVGSQPGQVPGFGQEAAFPPEVRAEHFAASVIKVFIKV